MGDKMKEKQHDEMKGGGKRKGEKAEGEIQISAVKSKEEEREKRSLTGREQGNKRICRNPDISNTLIFYKINV